jgi:hypothetical protein
VAHKRVRKNRSGRGRKTTTRAFLESPQKWKQAVGVRTQRQAQLEDQEEVVVKQGGADLVVKKENDNADGRDLDLPSIDDTIYGRS